MTCLVHAHGLERRAFLRASASAFLVGALAPRVALGAEGNYEAMVLSCMDPRMQEPVRAWLHGRGLTGKFSSFVIAGAAIGVVAPAFRDWQKAFWDNLAASVELHHIGKVIAIDHRDCGGAKIAYGAAAVVDKDAETRTHREAMAKFRSELRERQPKLSVETALMALDGSVEMFS
jgi:carbonic anhydrase